MSQEPKPIGDLLQSAETGQNFFGPFLEQVKKLQGLPDNWWEKKLPNEAEQLAQRAGGSVGDQVGKGLKDILLEGLTNNDPEIKNIFDVFEEKEPLGILLKTGGHLNTPEEKAQWAADTASSQQRLIIEGLKLSKSGQFGVLHRQWRDLKVSAETLEKIKRIMNFGEIFPS